MQKIIHSLWAQGRENAPNLVQEVFKSWERFAPEYELSILDQTGLDHHLSDLGLAGKGLTVQAASDVLRTKLLMEEGGVWMDATCLMTSPFEDWIGPMTAPAGFFAFYRPGPNRLLSSWLLSAETGHPFMAELLPTLKNYWSGSRRVLPAGKLARWDFRVRRFKGAMKRDPLWSVAIDGGARTNFAPYFFFHYLFEAMIKSQLNLAERWSQVPKRTALIPHVLDRTVGNGGIEDLATEDMQSLKALSPIHKLNWRKTYPASIFE